MSTLDAFIAILLCQDPTNIFSTGYSIFLCLVGWSCIGFLFFIFIFTTAMLFKKIS